MATENQQEKLELPLEVNVWVCINRKGDPCVKLQKETNKMDIIKTIAYCALNNVPLVVQPKFNNRLNSLASLIEKGIIYRIDKQLYFTEEAEDIKQC